MDRPPVDRLLADHPQAAHLLVDRPLADHPLAERLLADRHLADHPLAEHPPVGRRPMARAVRLGVDGPRTA